MLRKRKVILSCIMTLYMIMVLLNGVNADASRIGKNAPVVKFATPPVTEYIVGDRINFNIHCPSYGGKLEYRVVLWNDTKKTYYDLWNSGNGYPTRYYTKWKPYGNNIFTLGWIIYEPGSYRITVYAKRADISNNKTIMKGMNCDSYIESAAFTVKPRVSIQSVESIPDISVNIGSIPNLPSTVKVFMNDNTIRNMRVIWDKYDVSRAGIFIVQGTVEGTDKKASLKLIVNQPVFQVDNIYSVNVENCNKINVNLKNSISSIPDLWRFYIKNSKHFTPKIKTVVLSDDKKVMTLLTDFMIPGEGYTLVIDGKEYSLPVPYANMNKTINVMDCQILIGKTASPSISGYTGDMELYFISRNEDIASVDELSGKITGISQGTATIYVYGIRSGYAVSYGVFNVYVNMSQAPSKRYSEASYTDNGDGTATISLLIKDEDDEPINNLKGTDFIIENGEGTYWEGEEPFIELVFIRNGEYEITYSPDNLPADEYINIVVKDTIVVKNMHIRINKNGISAKPRPGIMQIGFYDEGPFSYDLDEGSPSIDIKLGDTLEYLEIEVIDNNIDTHDVEAVIKKPGVGTAQGEFIYNGEGIWSLSDGISFDRKGTYRISGTFCDKTGNEITITIYINVE